MGLWRKRQRDSGGAVQGETGRSEEEGGQQKAASNDLGLPGSAGYGFGRLPKNKRRANMPGTRFKFVRPDGREE